jgi:hypothetical protein
MAQKGAIRRKRAQLGAKWRNSAHLKYHMDNGLEFKAKHIRGFIKNPNI